VSGSYSICSDQAMTKRRKIARLRAQGLTLQEIGERLGVSRQRIHALLKEEDVPRPGIICRRCRNEIAPWPGASRNLGPVYCVDCLPANASFGLRLRAYRVAAKLTQAELASRIGVPPGMICYWERDQRRPMRRNLAALAAILGAKLKRSPG
jgi:transcriptional regulator with XRE-family HTH domain